MTLRTTVAALALVGCYRDATPLPSPIIGGVAEPRSTPDLRYSAVSVLTPAIVNGAVLGQSFDALRAARPQIVKDPEDYDFRQHYTEEIDADGITVAHYYTMPNEGVMYQISFDFEEKAEGAAKAMWDPYRARGKMTEDLGGLEVIIAGYPFEVRVWAGSARFQLMAVIEGNEWWDQYHPEDRKPDPPAGTPTAPSRSNPNPSPLPLGL